MFSGILILFMSISFTIKAQEIQWMSIEDVEEAIENEPRKVFVDVYTDWCGWCKRMDTSTFSEKDIIDFLNENYYCVKLDGEDKDVLQFSGHSFKFIDQGRRGYNELAYAILEGKLSYPTYVFLDENLDVLQRIKGYTTAKVLLPILDFLGNDIYKTTNWEDFVEESKGEKE